MLLKLVAGVLAIGLLLLWLAPRILNMGTKKLLPGPPRLPPPIENLHQAPDKDPWRQYQEWTKQYVPIFSLQYGLSTIIMLGNRNAARDLVDKRSHIYSSRPRTVLGW